MNQIAPRPVRSLSHVTDWVFDLDNTLYPRECNLFAQIDTLITHYVMDVTRLDFAEARALQKRYYKDFGTTLNGLMHTHQIDPDHFLGKVHAIDYSGVAPHPDLVAAIKALPGRKFILTNADVGHAEAVLDKVGAAGLFEGIFDIRAMKYQPKPLPVAYEAFFAAHGIGSRNAAMFDDLEKNLKVPHDTGMITVQVVAGQGFAHEQVEAWELTRSQDEHVHHITDDLASFLARLP
ncbi:putative hydrolase of the HAD superfamily [Devosia enhydra]|uniref:Putative hydrolase of the HAD superfamily n=1 Tax=Devosia enhydra TaxID=665118 RepID=A0A1K2I229_9HYPH|nr:pyrimidine 5'-nucleotidase [Devosia enhydra]SFZ86393.1 putative hydrolase of the HAD superfamily [Devosia enhydra]